MRVAVTGTPGVGKTSACRFVSSMPVVSVNDLVEEFGAAVGVDGARKTKIVDTAKLARAMAGLKDDMVIEGHLSHLLRPDIAIVLRCSPAVITKRLKKKKWSKEKIRENAEAEAVDVVLIEALDSARKVYEIDTTKMTPRKVAKAIEEIIAGKRQKYRVGAVDWSQEVLGWF